MPSRGRRRKGGAAPPLPVRSRSRVAKALTLLFAVAWLSALVRWWPLARYTVWGSDQGEYAALLGSFMATGGGTPNNYGGWGVAYPDFTGMYSLAGTFSALSGADPFVTLSVVVPAAAALTAVVAFALTLRLTGSVRASTVAGVIVAVAMPEAFAGSHAMPGALGGLLAFGAVAFVVFSAKSPTARWAAVALCLALIPTHHLSAFIAGAALVVVALFEARMGPADAARDRIVDSALAAAAVLLVGSAFFWAYGAPHFRAGVLDTVSPTVAAVLPGGALVGMVAVTALAYFLEGRPRRSRGGAHIFDERVTIRRLAGACAAAAVASAMVATIGVPGTSAVIRPEDALVFLPLALVLAMASVGPGRLLPVRGGLAPTAAVLAVFASLVLGLVLLPTVLLPYRHVQYFVDFAAPLAAVALTFVARAVAVTAFPERPRAHRWVPTLIVAAALAAASLSVYPDKEALAGYQEGTTTSEAAAVTWMAWDLPYTLVVTDHRMSSLAFGFANQRATWDSGGPVLNGDAGQARDALGTVADPRGNSGVTTVLLTDDIVEGAALSQWTPADPIEGPALAKFSGPGYVKLFDNGDAVAYWATG